ncbi:hypothetical protein SAMN04488504_102171 [Myxococcus virescens]|uniref:Uncharacterized protein n=1 Tax=Myxococcus virescens TaxID=83456 RepID=A0ABY0MJH2_9BACT|nr:hypothetical protein SAMN04488504_102171 [Myxococcus virescens]
MKHATCFNISEMILLDALPRIGASVDRSTIPPLLPSDAISLRDNTQQALRMPLNGMRPSRIETPIQDWVGRDTPCPASRLVAVGNWAGTAGHLKNSTPASSFRNRRRVPERNTPSALVRTHALESVECSLPERTASARLLLRPRCPRGWGLVKSRSTCGDSWSVAVCVLPVPRRRPTWNTARASCRAGCHRPRSRPIPTGIRSSPRMGTQHPPLCSAEFGGHGASCLSWSQHPPRMAFAGERQGGVSCPGRGSSGMTTLLRTVQGSGVELP